jgi:hypothetical protein
MKQQDINIYFVDDTAVPLRFLMSEGEDGEPRWEFVVRDSDPVVSHSIDANHIIKNKIPITEAAASFAERLSDKRAERFEVLVDKDGVTEKHEGFYNLEYPTVARMARAFTDATAKWWKAGRPTRSEEEMDSILEDKCRPCKYFSEDRGKPRCKICGCTLQKNGIVSKLKMATESCPKGYW